MSSRAGQTGKVYETGAAAVGAAGLSVRKRRTFPALGIFGMLVYLFLYLPLFVVVLFSFNNSKSAFSFSNLGVGWYEQVFANDKIITALGNSFLVSGVAVAVAVIIGTSGALFLNSVHFKGQSLFKAVANLPYVLPGIIVGVSLLLLLTNMGIKLSLGTVLIGHMTFTTAVVMFQVLARLQRLSPNLAKAAMDLGASPFKSFVYVTLPMIKRAIIGGALLAFTMSFDEIIITYFLTSTESTLPVFIYGSIRFGISPEIYAISTVVLLLSIVLIMIMARYTGTEDDKLIK
ncbi:MAG: ABC transporter permease [Clostridiales bacterium]|nr:ABC transporter permease [Clostridiales bacterium]